MRTGSEPASDPNFGEGEEDVDPVHEDSYRGEVPLYTSRMQLAPINPVRVRP